jgi:hypothetical protein
MSTDRRIDTFVLQEFRLHAAEGGDEDARIVATFSGSTEQAVPLLTSIDDPRDVAIVRALHSGENADGDPESVPRSTRLSRAGDPKALRATHRRALCESSHVSPGSL